MQEHLIIPTYSPLTMILYLAEMTLGNAMLDKDWTSYAYLLRDFVVGILALGGALVAWRKTRQAYSWPSTQGTVMWAEARVAGQNDQHWRGELAYSYSVDSEYYSGFYVIKAKNERQAEEKVVGWKGRMVVVRYHPSDHGNSILLKDDQPGGQLGNELR